MKKKTIIRGALLALFLLFMIAAGKFGYDYYKYSHINAETFLKTALTQLEQRKSFRFTLTTDLKLNNYATAKTIIAGERDTQNNLHIWGEIMDTDMEIFQFDDTCYRYQTNTEQWVTVENHPLTDQPLLLMEICPESNFTDLNLSSQSYLGKKIKNGKIYHIYTLNFDDNKLLSSTYYKNFSYKIYIEAKTKEIAYTSITATAKANEKNTLSLMVKFTDINADFLLTPPV